MKNAAPRRAARSGPPTLAMPLLGIRLLPPEDMPLSTAIFLTDSQSALALLFTAPTFLQLKSFWNSWDLSDSLSSCIGLSFQWVPSHASLRLCSQPAIPGHCKEKVYPVCYGDENLFHNFSFARFLRFPWRKWPSPVSPAVNCPHFAATVTAFFCSLT